MGKILFLNKAFRSQKPGNIDKAISKKAKNLANIQTKITEMKPELPLYCVRPHMVQKTAKFFVKNFTNLKHKSRIIYSVKSNPEEIILRNLFDSGITEFDVASINEVKLINELFGKNCKMFFMHPIKSRETIFDSYFNYGIKDYSLDSIFELEKILEVTNYAKDLNLHVRLAIPNSHSVIDLSSKFGILPSKSISLLRKAQGAAKKLGICFHVGSQCMDPKEYRNAISIAKETIEEANIKIDSLDIGGGFPSSYPGMTPPDLQSYFDEIFDAIKHANFDSNIEIICEPGRALVAESTSLIVRVEARKENMLYLNDGTYGGLFDAGSLGFIYPTKAYKINENHNFDEKLEPFGFFGPTCDSIDTMKGPFYLPKDIDEGDYIEIGQMGAYSRSIRTKFNGFENSLLTEISDEPLVSLFANEPTQNKKHFFKKNK